MSNVMYIVCTHHADRVHSFRIGSRGTGTRYVTSSKMGPKLDDWLEAHASCGGGFDHFSLAFDLPKDHDVPVTNRVSNGVHLALCPSDRSNKQENV